MKRCCNMISICGVVRNVQRFQIALVLTAEGFERYAIFRAFAMTKDFQ